MNIGQRPLPIRTQAEHYGDLARAAWTEGQVCLARGDVDAARRWLDRAHRIAPEDPNTQLALAAVSLNAGEPERAAALFRSVAEKHDLREAWLGLAAALRVGGQVRAAASVLGAMLARHAVPPGQDIADLIGAIIKAVGALGWCCLEPDRRLKIVADGRSTILADGRSWRARDVLPMSVVEVRITRDGRDLIGSPLSPARIHRLDGIVWARRGVVEGWAWHPGNPDTAPCVTFRPDAGGAASMTSFVEPFVDDARPFARLRRICVPAPGDGLFRVLGADGRDLLGSPLDPLAEQFDAASAARAIGDAWTGRAPAPGLRATAVPADVVGPSAVSVRTPRRPVAVVVPVHGGGQVARDCLASVKATVPGETSIIVVDDAGPDAALADFLDAEAQAGSIVLIRHQTNRGFPASANAGMRAALALPARPDIVLLNSDTRVPPRWLERLRSAVHVTTDIGTAAPLSNDATILSYPQRGTANPPPEARALTGLARLAAKANPGEVVDIPTSVGFCMYIRRECLDSVGGFRESLFAQGYGEENDFCMRARHLGWRHVAVPGVFVAHVGGQSFGAARQQLVRRNLEVLERQHPGYHALIAAFELADPLAASRRRLDAARWRDRSGPSRPGQPPHAVVIVTHDSGGGVERVVRERCAQIRADGGRAIVLRPVLRRGDGSTDALYEAGTCVVGDGTEGGFPNLRYRIPEELPELAALLAPDGPTALEVHHLLGHDHGLMALARHLGVPVDLRMHDYASICPRITLVHAERRYCGEPTDTTVCDACIADGGRNIEEAISVAALRARSAVDLSMARSVTVPSADTAARLRRHFPTARLTVQPQDRLGFVRPVEPPGPGPLHVAVLGAVGTEKGYDVLLACARDARARALPLRFTVVGHTSDDERLLETGRVFVTGPYREDEAVSLVRAQRAHLAFLPSIWPETWCFTLTQAWQAGLRVVAFDLGAPAERIRAGGHGRLLPLGLPPSGVNNALLAVPPATGDECAA